MSDPQSNEESDTGRRAPGGGPGGAFGAYLRSQRELASMSLRQLAALARVSNPYLSQIERGLHQPSVAVIRAIADALGLSAEDLLVYAAGLTEEDHATQPGTEAAIRSDPRLTDAQKRALLEVYRSMAGGAEGPEGAP